MFESSLKPATTKKIISSYHDPLAARSGRKGLLEYSLQEWDLLQPAGVPQPQGWDFMEAFASQPAALLTFTKELLKEKQAGELPTEGLEFVRDTELAGIKKWDFQQKIQGLPVLDAAGEQVFLPAPRLGSASGRRECLRQVSETLSRILGFSQSVDSLERMNRKISQWVPEYWDTQDPPPRSDEGSLLVLSAGGKGVPMRHASTPGSGSVAGSPKGVKPGTKKMALVGASY